MGDTGDALKGYTIIKEGEAEILMHSSNAVFFNKTQVCIFVKVRIANCFIDAVLFFNLHDIMHNSIDNHRRKWLIGSCCLFPDLGGFSVYLPFIFLIYSLFSFFFFH